MRKALFILSVLALSAGAVLAQAPGPLTVEQRLEIIRMGKNHPGMLQNLRVDSAGTVTLPAGSIEAADLANGAVTAAKIDTVAGADVIVDVVTATVTNGQAYTLVWGKVNKLTSVGSAQDLTNTITLANTAGNVAAADVGKVTYLVNHFYSTNDIAIDIDGNLYGPANVVLSDGASVILIPIATNEVYVIER